MSDRHPRRRVGAIVAVAALTLAGAIVATALSAMLQAQINDFYSSDLDGDLGQAAYDRITQLASLAFTLQSSATPLVLAAVVAVAVALSLLAVRWRPAPTSQPPR